MSILPITQNNEIILLRQYRAPLNSIIIELPAGCAETGKHATLLDAATSELREESGYISEDYTPIGIFPSSSGMTNETVNGYIAKNCKKVSSTLELDQDEYIQVMEIPLSGIHGFLLRCIEHEIMVDPKVYAFLQIYFMLE